VGEEMLQKHSNNAMKRALMTLSGLLDPIDQQIFFQQEEARVIQSKSARAQLFMEELNYTVEVLKSAQV
jgi:hypothetical protein